MRSPGETSHPRVSRKSVAALVTDIVAHPGRWVRANLGVNKLGMYGDKPAFA